MKTYIYLLVFYLTTLILAFTAISSFGQSLVITPEQTVSDNTVGDNIGIQSNSPFLGIYGVRYNGTAASKSPVTNNDHLLRIGARGYYDPSNTTYEKAAIFFKATQNWSSTANGTKISFLTTSNNSTITNERMLIDQNGNIGIGTSAPTAILQINKADTSVYNAHIHLQNTAKEGLGYGSSSTIKVSSTNKPGEWLNQFVANENPAASSVSWICLPAGTTPLSLDGFGNAYIQRNANIGGYTNLGLAAPPIKMKRLAITTSGAAGGTVTIAHGLTQSKILSVSVLVNATTGDDIPPSYSHYLNSDYLYFFRVSSTNIIIENSNGNHAQIAGRPVRILITYEE
jgi:hypothetical protein